MNTVQDILVFVTETIFSLFLVMVLLRLFLQSARADFYNPLSQSIVKITNPLLIPLRRIIPGVFGIDIASIFLAILTQFIFGELVAIILTGTFFNPVNLLIWGILALFNLTCYIGFALILVLVISSFVAPYSSHPILTLVRQLSEPVLAPVRKVIPPVGGLDFSVMFVGMMLVIFQKILAAVAYEVRLVGQLVIGM
jgi:YggT family protein